LVQEPESGVEVVGLMTRAIPRAEVDLGRFFPRVLHLLNRSHGLWSGGSVPVPKVSSSANRPPRDEPSTSRSIQTISRHTQMLKYITAMLALQISQPNTTRTLLDLIKYL
jgi:hypothetical protein